MPACTTASIMGQGQIDSDAYMYAGTTSNPTDVAYMIFKCEAADSSTTITVRVKFTIIYDIIFKDLNPSFSSLMEKPQPKKKVTIVK